MKKADLKNKWSEPCTVTIKEISLIDQNSMIHHLEKNHTN